MLLNGERPWIKRDTEEGNIRHVASPGVANWETQQHGENLISHLATGIPKKRLNAIEKIFTNLTAEAAVADDDGGVSKIEELVRAGYEDCPN